MKDTIEIGSGEGRVRVEGLGRTIRQMSKAGADAEDLKSLMHTIGSLVINAANPPRQSGALANTLRPGRGKTKAVVRAGGARTPYAGVIHYGWPARNIAPQPFLTDALNSKRTDVFRELDKNLNTILKKHDLI